VWGYNDTITRYFDMTNRDFQGGLLRTLSLLTAALAVLATAPAMATSDSDIDSDAVRTRIAPVGKLNIAGASSGGASAAAPAAADGSGTYNGACAACHATGAAGAPKVGDKADWGPRIKQGKAMLYSHAIKGFQGKKGFMPAKGGQTQLSDANVKAAVDHMVSKSK
jgi:cytochrome c5